MSSNSNTSDKPNNRNKNKVPPLIINKSRLLSKNEDSNSPSPNSDNEFRSPRKTTKAQDRSNTRTTFFSTPNRYSALDCMETGQTDTPPNTSDTIDVPTNDQNVNPNNNDIQIQSTDNLPKIPPLFVINISEFTQFRQLISTVIHNDFTIAAKINNIKINLQTIEDFRSLTKFLDEKKYEYYTYRLKEEKGISAIIRNLPMSITETEVTEELNNLNFPVHTVIRLTNKDKVPTPLLAIQLLNNPKAQEIFKLNKLLNCIITIEPRRKSNDPPQCTNCQRYGHIYKSCKLQSRCVKCNGSHPANYKGCTYFKKIKQKKSVNIQSKLPTENIPLINTTTNKISSNNNKPTQNISNQASYADIIRGKTNHAHPTQTNAENTSTEFLNENLQKTIKKFIENILQNIQTIISSIFHSITNNLSIPLNNEHN
jgi:hypothetical protein